MRHKLILLVLSLLVASHYGWLLKRHSAELDLRDEVQSLRQRLIDMRRLEHELAALRALDAKLRVGLGVQVADSERVVAGKPLTNALAWGRESSLLSLPVSGRFSRGFQQGGWPGGVRHHGLDIACSAGQAVTAAAEGVVLFAGRTERFGDFVLIQHDEEVVTGYGHLAGALPAVGSLVGRGDLVGLVAPGADGRGSHVHFSVQRGGQPIDPVFMLDVEVKERTSG